MNGALLVDKPAGVTSHDVVAIVRRALQTKSVGHTGTLDPFATGLLVVLVGKATRLARFLDGHEKVYHTVVRLGQGTETDDSTGALLPSGPATRDSRPDAAALSAALQGFLGRQLQVPPAYSAKKVDGERAYARARKGEAVVLKAVEVTIHRIELLRYDWPDVELRVHASTGTYIRSLARDLGTKLGTLAHCAELRRERIGAFKVTDARTLETLQGAGREGRGAAAGMITPAQLVAHLPRQELGEGEAAFVRHGRKIATEHQAGPIALLHRGELLAIAEVDEGMAHPVVVLGE